MATVMATGNADMENAAVDLVDPGPDAKVLMIGCGPGVGVVAAARRASNGMVIGLDPSSLGGGFEDQQARGGSSPGRRRRRRLAES